MSEITSYCEHNKDFMDLLAIFNEEYITSYNALNVNDRKKVKIYLRRNFAHWYYSVLDTGESSPANFINSDIHSKFNNSVMVFPLCKPIYKKEKIICITYEFKVFGLNEHPFIQDMKAFLVMLLDNEILCDNNKVIDVSTEDAIKIAVDKNFSFAEECYLYTLAGTCNGLNLTAIKTENLNNRLVVNADVADEFFSLPARDKLEKIVLFNAEEFIASLTTFIQNNEIAQKIPSVEQVLNVLKKGMTIIDYFNELFCNIMDDLHDLGFESIDDIYDINDKSDINDLDKFNDLLESYDNPDIDVDIFDILGENVSKVMLLKSINSIAARYFFLIYGNYLQLIHPLYLLQDSNDSDSDFLYMLKYNPSEQNALAFQIYMVSPDCYRLSPIGVDLFRDGIPEPDPEFHEVDPDLYSEVLDQMLDPSSLYSEDFPFFDFSSDNVLFPDFQINNRVDKSDRKNNKKVLSFYGKDDKSSDYAKKFPSEDKLDCLMNLNPKGLPVFNDVEAIYKFKVKKYSDKRTYKNIELKGSGTLTQLADMIREAFDLGDLHLYSFFMGTKFYDSHREIQAPYLECDSFTASDYCIFELGLFKKQKFLFLYDFGSEERFEIEFMG